MASSPGTSGSGPSGVALPDASTETEPTSLEDQARQHAIDAYLATFASTGPVLETQNTVGRGHLAWELLTDVESWTNETPVVVGGGEAGTSLTMRLRYGTTSTQDATSDAQRQVGEWEYRQIRLQATPEALSVADDANGVTWRGRVALKYLYRYREVDSRVPSVETASDDRAARLMDFITDADVAMPEWSEWMDVDGSAMPGSAFRISLKSGVWSIAASHLVEGLPTRDANTIHTLLWNNFCIGAGNCVRDETIEIN